MFDQREKVIEQGRLHSNFYRNNYSDASAPPVEYGLSHHHQTGVHSQRLEATAEQPITGQPFGQEGVSDPNNIYLNMPQSIPNCPPGLETLAMTNELIVKQKVEVSEDSSGLRTRNKFTVTNKLGQKIYTPFEDSNYSTYGRIALIDSDMIILDNSRKEVLHFHRSAACDCCCPSYSQTVSISVPQGRILGTVKQELNIFSNSFVVKNASGDIALKIVGPWFPRMFGLFNDVDFQIQSHDGLRQVGKITKQWSNPCSDAYNFRVTFLKDLDVTLKATILGACFLIDVLFFEQYKQTHVM